MVARIRYYDPGRSVMVNCQTKSISGWRLARKFKNECLPIYRGRCNQYHLCIRGVVKGTYNKLSRYCVATRQLSDILQAPWNRAFRDPDALFIRTQAPRRRIWVVRDQRIFTVVIFFTPCRCWDWCKLCGNLLDQRYPRKLNFYLGSVTYKADHRR